MAPPKLIRTPDGRETQFAVNHLGHFALAVGLHPALAAADKIRRIMTEDILTMKDRPKLVMTTEAYYGMRTHVQVRFGRWQEIIDQPPPGDPAIYRVSTPMHHYARGIAYATLKDPVSADRERALFREAVARMPPEQKFLGNFARNTLGVGEAMLDGEMDREVFDFEQCLAWHIMRFL